MEEETLKKVVLHSVATAFARRVFPVPGGPTISTPYKNEKEPRLGQESKQRISQFV